MPTDYRKIASIYDDAAYRHVNPQDDFLGARLEKRSGPQAVLDLACGTGNWLCAQREVYPDSRIAWHGIDASPEMLERARAKLDGVRLSVGAAESLPFDDGAFDYLACNFAFHHFEDKHAALDEIGRVLKGDGALRIQNLAADRAPDWWVFQFFPEARLHDEERFWPTELLFHELEQRGFTVRAEIRMVLERRPAQRMYEDARHRDMSSIAIVSDRQFREGLEQLKGLADRGEEVFNQEALLICTAERRQD